MLWVFSPSVDNRCPKYVTSITIQPGQNRLKVNHKHYHNGWFQCSNKCYRQVQQTLRCVEEHACTKVLSTYTVTTLIQPKCNILLMATHFHNIPQYRRDSHASVGTATRLQAGQPRNWCSIPGSVKILFSTSRCPDRLWDPSSRLIEGYRWCPSPNSFARE
jgi:hypothetical protein